MMKKNELKNLITTALCLSSFFLLTACEQKYKIAVDESDPSSKDSPAAEHVSTIISPPESSSSLSSSFSSSVASSAISSDGSSASVSSASVSSASSSSDISIVMITPQPSASPSASPSPSQPPCSSAPSSSSSSSEVTVIENPPSSTSSAASSEAPAVSVATAQEFYPLANSEIKKIDFLFIVDNSGSMKNNQAKLAAGFKNFADTFYRRRDLDICTQIITSDRYLGKSEKDTQTGAVIYSRERSVNCTRPDGWDSKTAEEQEKYTSELIADFTNKVKVGINGSDRELLGKSLVSFLYKLTGFGSSINAVPKIDPTKTTSFFRKDAVANITFITDENNWYGPDFSKDNKNDIPAFAGAKATTATGTVVDSRKGIKNYLDDFFSALNPQSGSSYSVVSLLELTPSENLKAGVAKGIAQNLLNLPKSISRESLLGNIENSAQSYADAYNSISEKLIKRTSAVSLKQNLYEPTLPAGTPSGLKATLVRADGSRSMLTYGKDYNVLLPNGILLNANVVNTLQPNDSLKVEYNYLLP